MERFACFQIPPNLEIILILFCCMDGSKGQACSPDDCDTLYFNAPLTLMPGNTCFSNGTQVQLGCPPGYILNGTDLNTCSFGTWILPPSVCEDDPDYNPQTSTFGTSSTETSMTSKFETTSGKSTLNTTFSTTLKAATQLRTDEKAATTQKTTIVDTTSLYQTTRFKEATLVDITHFLTMPSGTTKLTSTTENKRTTHDTTTLKMTTLHVTTHHDEITNDSPTSYDAKTPDRTKIGEETTLHVTSHATTNGTPTTYDATTGDRITSHVTTSRDSRTTDTKTTPVMTSTDNAKTLHLTSNGLETVNETSTRQEVTTADMFTGHKSTTLLATISSITSTGTNYKTCPFDRVSVSGVVVTFEATTPGNSVGSLEKCKDGSLNAGQSLATRRCGEDFWEEPELLSCYSPEDVSTELEKLAKTNVTEENVEEVAHDVALVTSQDPESLTSSEIVNVADSLGSIAETGSSSPEVTDSVIGTVNNIMEVEEEELQQSHESSRNILMSLEQQVTNVQQNPYNFTEVEENVGVRAIKVNPNITYAITFVILSPTDRDIQERLDADLSEENTVLFNKNTEVEAKNSTTSIFVPRRVLEVAKKADSNLREIPISFLIYKDARLFQTSSPDLYKNGSITIREAIASQVVSATLEMENVSINNLEEDSAVISRFTTIDQTDGNVIEKICVFWDVTGQKWSDVGCKTDTKSSTNNQTVCYCDHLTSFAVLIRLDVTELPKYLDYITWIGSSLSVIGLTACIVTLTSFKKLRQKQSSQIHVNLCLCLIGFNVCFMTGDLAINNPTHCKNIATATHFFCLATFAWMSTEAINMYLVFVKFLKPRLEYFVPVSCVLTYGLSVAIALTVFFLTEENNFSNYCFLHPGYPLYFGLILEIFLLLVLNSGIFILVIRKVVFRPILSTSARNNKKKEIFARIQQFVLFWVLLGLSWIFGFLTLIPNRLNYAFEFLFCIFISLQGFLLSIFIFMKNPEVRNSLRKVKERLSMKSSNAVSNDSTASSSASWFGVFLLRFTHRKDSSSNKPSQSISSL